MLKSAKALRLRHVSLSVALLLSLAGAMAIAITAAWLLALWLNIGTQRTSPTDLVRLALTIAAGVGGVVALVVAYRRQLLLEQGKFIEGFGAAAEQLGNSDPAVRMAGVYAMAGVADQTSSKLQRQQCIDVLCGYLRLPYSPELGRNHQTGVVVKKPMHRKGGAEEEIHFRYRQNDKEVRQTIVRVVADHSRKDSTHSWSTCDFDFTGCIFEDAFFNDVTFGGRITAFRMATFTGQSTSFNGATFSAVGTVFDQATFCSQYTSFDAATFSGRFTSFIGATFSGQLTLFHGATFGGEHTAFDGVTFSGSVTTFNEAVFGGGVTSFKSASFTGGRTSFKEVTFSGRKIYFNGPVAWDPAPTFDWDPQGVLVAELKPTNVLPTDWPPSPIPR